MVKRNFDKWQKLAIYLAYNGHCAICNQPLGDNWHADHIIPFILGGETDVINGQPLCPNCNLKKGDKMIHIKDWPNNIQLRTWQRQAIREYQERNQIDFLAVATPGAGKTVFALSIAHDLLKRGLIKQVVIVCPSDHLRTQWMKNAHSVGIELSTEFTKVASKIIMPSDFTGIVTTYQEVSAHRGEPYRWYCQRYPTFVIFDEIHHCGDELSWGDSVRNGFEHGYRRLLLSGTPFRSDDNEIPFVNYKLEGNIKRSQADYTYGYGDALQDDTVCRLVVFPTYDGEMKWSSGFDIKTATFSDNLSEADARERLKTALDARGDWLKTVLEEANKKLDEIRTSTESPHPNAAGLVIAKDQYHARQIVDLLKDITNEAPAIAISDDTEASSIISNFQKSRSKWIIAVKMISEGVDIPRLRIGVFATNVSTELFFRQAVGRVIRWIDGIKTQDAFFYVPKVDPLLAYIEQIKQERDHVLELDNENEANNEQGSTFEGGNKQLPFFAPISSTANEGGKFLGDEYFSLEELENARKVQLQSGFKDIEDVKIAKIVRVSSVGNGISQPMVTQNPPTIPQKSKQERITQLRARANKTVSQLKHLLIETRGENITEAIISGIWINKMNGLKADKATEVDLEKKIIWLNTQIDQIKKGTWRGWPR